MDGTLIDTEKFYAQGWLKVAEDFGYEPSRELAASMSGVAVQDMPEIIGRFYPGMDAKKYIKGVVDFVMEKRKSGISLMKGAKELLTFFSSNGVAMSVASSSLEKTVEDSMIRTGIRDCFAALVGGDQVERSKPDPDIFILAASKMGVPPEDCYIFEDSFSGIKAAHAAGGTAIMIPDQVQPNEEILPLCKVYDSLLDAMEAIKSGEI